MFLACSRLSVSEACEERRRERSERTIKQGGLTFAVTRFFFQSLRSRRLSSRAPLIESLEQARCSGQKPNILKELRHDILSYFFDRQNYCKSIVKPKNNG